MLPRLELGGRRSRLKPSMNDLFFRGDYGAAPTNYPTLVIALLLAFACGHAIAWVYMITHSGLSYSRSYVNTLILMPVIVAMVMMILANNLVPVSYTHLTLPT